LHLILEAPRPARFLAAGFRRGGAARFFDGFDDASAAGSSCGAHVTLFCFAGEPS